jgi:hypothetical protein
MHTEKTNQYESWEQVLSANPENRLQLDMEDWQLFFAKT